MASLRSTVIAPPAPMSSAVSGCARLVVAEGDAAEALAQVLERGGEAEDGHDLAGDGDVVAGLARQAVEPPAEAVDDLAHGAVVEVDAAAPGDGERIDVELVAVHDVAVDHGGEQVVGRADGVDVAGEVQVEVLHREELRVAAAGGAALDAEDRAEGGLTQGQHGVHADRVHALREADGRDRLALAQRRRGDGRHVDDLAVGLVLEAVEHGHVVDLGLVATVQLQLVLEDACLLGDRLDGLHGGGLGDLDVARHRGLANDRTQRVLLWSPLSRASRLWLPGPSRECDARRYGPGETRRLVPDSTSGTQKRSISNIGCPARRTEVTKIARTGGRQEPLKRLRAADWAAS